MKCNRNIESLEELLKRMNPFRCFSCFQVEYSVDSVVVLARECALVALRFIVFLSILFFFSLMNIFLVFCSDLMLNILLCLCILQLTVKFSFGTHRAIALQSHLEKSYDRIIVGLCKTIIEPKSL